MPSNQVSNYLKSLKNILSWITSFDNIFIHLNTVFDINIHEQKLDYIFYSECWTDKRGKLKNINTFNV